MAAVRERSGADSGRAGVAVIDCDVHNALKPGELLEYLPSKWHQYYAQMEGNSRQRAGLTIGARPQPGNRVDSAPPSGGPPGSDLDFLREQLLDEYGVAKALLTWFGYNPQHGELGLALARTLNEWMARAWLDQEDRFVAAISIPQEDGTRSAAEIRRVTDADPRFVAVLMTVLMREPLGHTKYWPIFEACAERELPLIVHVGGWSGVDIAGGWPALHIESHCHWPSVYVAHAVSLVYSGAFARYPKLKIVMQEGGLGWLPSTMWRLDRSWRQMRNEVPHLTEPPSATLRRHLWLTTQPMEETERPEQLLELLNQIDMDDHILFSSDYPHHDFDSPQRAIPALLGPERREKIFSRNAKALFNFPTP
jgi:uncharacterized protein